MATFNALIEDIDKKFFASVYNAVKTTGQEVIAELQQRGPSWTGRFSNSWELAEGNIAVSGNRAQGEPLAVLFPKAAPSLRKFTGNAEVVFRITNISPQPYKDLALDKIEGQFEHITPEPLTALGLSKYEEFTQGRSFSSRRGAAGTGGPGLSSRTAALDWYSDYLSGGYIPRIIKTQLSAIVYRAQ
jgi:hypothetical protein